MLYFYYNLKGVYMKLQRVFHFALIFVTLILMACGESNPSKGEEENISSSSINGNITSSSNNSSSSSSLGALSSSSSEEEVVPCSFLASDSVWSYSVNTSNGTDGGSIDVSYEISDKNLIRIEMARISGSASSFVCRLMGSDENVTDFFDDSTYIKTSICNGSEMISTSTIIKENFFDTTTVEDFYASVLNSCKIANEMITAPEVSTEKMVTSCDFKVEDNVWEYSYGDSSSYTIKRYVFDGEDVTSFNYMIDAMDYAECLAITPSSQSLRYCDEVGLLEIASSGFTVEENEKSTYFESIQEDCLEYVPASDEEDTVIE